MSSAKDQRMAAYANPIRGHGMGSFARGGTFLPSGPHPGYHGGDAHMSTLANGMGAMNLHHVASFPSAGRPNGNVAQNSFDATGGHNQQVFMGLQNLQPGQHYYLPGANQGPSNMHHSPSMYSPYVPNAYPPGMGMMPDNSPIGRSWPSGVSSSDVPNLLTPRRESLSSNEAEYPGTPLTGYGMYTNPQVMDRSPSGVFTASATPSPNQMQQPYGIGAPISKAVVTTNPPSSVCPVHIQIKLQQDPPIPSAIPAPNSPNKPLDRSLENKNGETNVYIRGLQPETKDEDLFQWGKRFGDIQSSKSIIDMKTDKCKGFGFIKYYNFEDAEQCIRGFHHLGYEELGLVFAPFKVCSSRILRDQNGNGRGVGFARFETRDICEQVIRQFNNQPISRPGQGGEEHLIQIRYSDTHEQKILKQQTAAGRQFRAQEYEVGVAQARGALSDSRFFPNAQRNEFETFLQNSAYTHPSVSGATTPSSKTIPSAHAPGMTGMAMWSNGRSHTSVPGIAINGMAAPTTMPQSPTGSVISCAQVSGEAVRISRSGPTTPTKGERTQGKAASEHE
ncbi:hypothetical protein EJ05DRAFT_488108 [Pseudovirgaria hyperparasitica]|uniref:RRM domain-containing protein n=1 Tax=Pseudovirgaria hyperparasitica TaxID=470096 RepID=A0A6A6VYH4_9PEZI|nr:uncharacterized protein EJ05DRAFT_488108 [Pseudovirgaria hyperparasitica]KAF2755323.1 hypothetical protein EJ05DRAFT_488108 [Pseudovirgaria hyperparasitica]